MMDFIKCGKVIRRGGIYCNIDNLPIGSDCKITEKDGVEVFDIREIKSFSGFDRIGKTKLGNNIAFSSNYLDDIKYYKMPKCPPSEKEIEYLEKAFNEIWEDIKP